MNHALYSLPQLPYGYNDLEPYISENQLMIHHTKHHQAYVNGLNLVLQKLENARHDNAELDMKAALKDLSFNLGGYILHSIFWNNLAPAAKGGGGMPTGSLKEMIESSFESLERFKKEFNQAASSVEGSGWAVLVFSKETNQLMLMQIEKHNLNLYPESMILMVLDVFEHAYYLDYKNERAKFIDAFWSIVNWPDVQKRLELAQK